MLLDSNILIDAAEPEGVFLSRWVEDAAACLATVKPDSDEIVVRPTDLDLIVTQITRADGVPRLAGHPFLVRPTRPRAAMNLVENGRRSMRRSRRAQAN